MKLFALREKELGRYVTRGPGDSEGVWPVRGVANEGVASY